ncbi:MAG: spore germination protein [Ruminococcaceae bacterium]|nr:spore germination protein [Oscillospiraceae bacterium]
MNVNKDINLNIKRIRESFPADSSADFVMDEFLISGRRACICFFNGLTDSELLLKVHENILCKTLPDTMSEFSKSIIPLTDKKLQGDIDIAINALLSSMSLLFIDGYCEALIMDTKKYPSRSVEEPEKNKTMRGPRDGFGESVFMNTALIRRRIKSDKLAFCEFSIGQETKTKVVLAYMRGKGNMRLVNEIKRRLSSLDIPSLTLSQQTLCDHIFLRKKSDKINPFPKVRYVERPDTAASMLVEGKIALLCDTSPSVIFFPITLYDMVEETDDYYFPPLTASYLRTLRVGMLFVSVFLSPLWLLALEYGDVLPKSLEFLLVDSKAYIPVWLQLIIVELMMDALKIASLNTPNTISNSLSVVSGLLLSDFAISAGWLVPQTILYSAISSIANFIPTNYELGYAFKFWRMTLIALCAIFKLWGFIAGTALFVAIMILNKSKNNKEFLYPISPFHKKGLLKLFFHTTEGNEK